MKDDASPVTAADREAEAAEVEDLLAKLADDDVLTRGIYDLAGLRADADVMVWWHATSVEQVQAAYLGEAVSEVAA